MSKEVIDALRKQADEIAREGHMGWGNTMTAAADAIDALLAERNGLAKDAERYRWLRNPDQDVSLVLDKVTGEVPADEFGCGGYRTYEYRAGQELDAAIDAAMQGAQP
jgi:chorismate mutase